VGKRPLPSNSHYARIFRSMIFLEVATRDLSVTTGGSLICCPALSSRAVDCPIEVAVSTRSLIGACATAAAPER